MSKNEKRMISIASIDKFLKGLNTGTKTVTLVAGDVSVDIEVRRNISIQEFSDMVTEAAEICFQYGEDGQVYYVAGLSSFACHYVLMKHLTNLKTAEDVDNKEQQNDRLYTLCTHTTLVRQVEKELPHTFVTDYHEAVFNQIEFKKQKMLSNERSALISAAEQLDKANATFAKFVEMFQGVDPTEFVGMMQKIVSMDETGLANAILTAEDKESTEYPF